MGASSTDRTFLAFTGAGGSNRRRGVSKTESINLEIGLDPVFKEQNNIISPNGSRSTAGAMGGNIYIPKTEFGKSLWKIRKAAIKSGMKLLDWDEIEEEISRRRV